MLELGVIIIAAETSWGKLLIVFYVTILDKTLFLLTDKLIYALHIC